MNAKELKDLQAPLKQQYKDLPESAILTLKAVGNLGQEISCKIDTGKAILEAGLHPASGGDGLLLCSGEMLLEALVACSGVTLKAVATALEIEILSGTIKAEGDLDFKGTLGVSKEVPVGFKNIRLDFEMKTGAGEEKLVSLKKLTDRYCVVFQTLLNGVNVESSIRTIK